MSIKIMSQVWESAPFDGYTLLTLLALSDSANDDGVTWPSVAYLMKKTRQPERTVYQAIANLVKAEWLSKTSREGSKKIIYRVTPPAHHAGELGNPPAPYAVPPAQPAKPHAYHAKPPHPLKGRNVIEPSLNRQAKAKPSPSKKTYDELPSWIDPQAWVNFAEMRDRLRKAMTPRARELLVDKLDKLRAGGQDVTAMLDQSTMNGWTDVYAVREEIQRNGRNRNGNDRIAQNAEVLRAALTGRGNNQGGAGGDGLLSGGDAHKTLSGRVFRSPSERVPPRSAGVVGTAGGDGATRGRNAVA